MKKFQTLLATALCLNLISCGYSGGQTGREGYKNQGEQMEDTKIVNFIRNKFRNDRLIPTSLIHIAVDRGIVQLSGFIRTYEEANLAVSSVKGTPGVKDVINSLVVLSGGEYAARRATVERYNTAR
ncbi:MAG: BON domain-containing protein [Rickettsiaceae bacterium]|nr:BON domain-containing protein [Rickettsiaceae bacterium]